MILWGEKTQLQALRDAQMGDETKLKSFEYSPSLTTLEHKLEMTNGHAM